ncbi:YeiH family protein [Erysipelothrix urinaevulpis]|uniref:YeiH family protein n=1 Tax=Erysipelothrix urinaevulpis TaxID=2683717 RepID=UPI00135CC23C|nr:putative sulfate exporter family transporter [Erysipelothrix urinaevulpis]
MKKNTIIGFCLALVLAIISVFFEKIIPVEFIGASVIALILGILLNSKLDLASNYQSGFKFTSKYILRAAIILLGGTMNIGLIMSIGKMSLSIIIFTLGAAFLFANVTRKYFGVNWRLANMVAAGNGICGGSAIAAMSPVIDAKDSEVAFAMSSTFLFDVAMILLFPLMGHLLGMSDVAFGLWTGTAVNDTSSVVAAGYAFSEAAGDFATTVKLTRTLSIIPTVLIFTYLSAKKQVSDTSNKVSVIKLFPWFILGFIALAIFNSVGIIPVKWVSPIKNLSKFLMVVSLASIGLNTHFEDMKEIGLKPMIFGILTAIVVIIVALIVIYAMGLMA